MMGMLLKGARALLAPVYTHVARKHTGYRERIHNRFATVLQCNISQDLKKKKSEALKSLSTHDCTLVRLH